jgi:hypothetical protein
MNEQPLRPDDRHKYIPTGSRRLGHYHQCEVCGRPPQEHMSRLDEAGISDG